MATDQGTCSQCFTQLAEAKVTFWGSRMTKPSFVRHSFVRTFVLSLFCSASFVASVDTALAQPQSQDQTACIVALNRNLDKVAKTQRGEAGRCLKLAARGRLPQDMTLGECLDADIKGKVNKALARMAGDDIKRCDIGDLPTFGYSGADAAGNMAAAQEIALFKDIYGLDPDASVLLSTEDKIGATCQADTIKRYGRILQVMTRAFRVCKAQGLDNGSIDSPATLESCFDELTNDPSGLVERARAKMEVRVRQKCFGVDLDAAFPGVCSDAVDAAAFTECAERKALCRTCIMINTADDILGYCDVFDDGVANATCVDPKRCGNGIVEPGEECDDGNDIDGDCCATDCSAETTGNPCDDGLFCTEVDECAGGLCIGLGDPCSAGGECANSCNENTDSCLLSQGTACSTDENPCTDDLCDGAGSCEHTFNVAPCDDGVFCNGADICSEGSCSDHAGNPCASGSECADDCNENAGNCFDAVGTSCLTDGNVCTDNICDGLGACIHPNNTVGCDDGLFCTVTDTCLNGTCVGAGNPCSGGDECSDLCDDAADNCHDPSGNACTDDGNPCTDDICDGSGGCSHPFNSAPCDDGNACTDGDVCFAGACTAGAPLNCDDANSCTDDSCNVATGCEYSNNTASCSDGNACTTADTCNGAGVCVGGAPPDCNDGEVCTDDSCNPQVGCENTSNVAACDDGIFCNGADTCSGGTCSDHAGDPCSGGNECADTCNEGAATCNEAQGTQCTSDGNVCTDNQCDGAGQCVANNNTDPCPGDGLCGGGICIPPNCSDSIQNANETDVDCGGIDCSACVAGEACLVPSDCESSVCSDGTCLAATCSDGIQNGNESDIDCGGDTCSGCLLGEICGAGGDCDSGTCTGNACTCGNQNLSLTINSSSGGAFSSAAWPGGTEQLTTSIGCSVTITRPEGGIELAGSSSVFAIASFEGFSACSPGTCEVLSCPFAGIGQCFGDRPNCSVATNGSGQARWNNINCSN